MKNIGWMIIALALLGATAIVAQDIRERGKGYIVNVDVQLVQIPVSVLDRNGHPVSGLESADFEVFEDGVLQDVSLFTHEDIPLSVGLVIDNSGSMQDKQERVNRAALAFARESNPEDETFIVNFDNVAYLEQDFTSSIDDLVSSLTLRETRGETAIYDALYLASEHLKLGKKDKKALLLISDGEDNMSTYSLDKVLSTLRASKSAVYTIGLLEEDAAQRGRSRKPHSSKARQVLERFAETTGGGAYFPGSVDEVEEICRRIAHDLRNQYTLGYTSSNANLDGSWRKITVRVNPRGVNSKMTVRAKNGYYAPKGSVTAAAQ